MKKNNVVCIVMVMILMFVVVTPGCGENSITTNSGLQFIEIREGTGSLPLLGDIVSVNYIGTLDDGTEFDNSYERSWPAEFIVGVGQVMPGWDEGIAMMKKGGKAKLIIPPDLAYGETGAGEGIIPPNATITLEVELVNIHTPGQAAPTPVDESDYTITESGLKYYDFEVGDGELPQNGQTIHVHYTGWLVDGTKFDSSLDRGYSHSFVIGVGDVISGWDEGVSTMKIGGKRQLQIPPDLGYGEAGSGVTIPPDAILIFEIELLGAV